MKYEEFDLIDFDKVELDEVEFDGEIIEKAKKNLLKSIDKLKEFNNDLDIDDSIGVISRICKEYGLTREDINSGEYNKRILKNLIFKSLCSKADKEHKDIKFRGFFTAGGQPIMVSVLYYSSTTFYYSVFVTDKEVIIYSLNNYFQVIKERKYGFKEIKGFGIDKPEYHKEENQVEKFKLELFKGDQYFRFRKSVCMDSEDMYKLDEVLSESLKGYNCENYNRDHFQNVDNKCYKKVGNTSVAISIIVVICCLLYLFL